jgi:hypothetical protein
MHSRAGLFVFRQQPSRHTHTPLLLLVEAKLGTAHILDRRPPHIPPVLAKVRTSGRAVKHRRAVENVSAWV